jgi:hypothetical protein
MRNRARQLASSGFGLRLRGSLPRGLVRAGPFSLNGGRFFVLHFACKLLGLQCDELRCVVLKMLISKG